MQFQNLVKNLKSLGILETTVSLLPRGVCGRPRVHRSSPCVCSVSDDDGEDDTTQWCNDEEKDAKGGRGRPESIFGKWHLIEISLTQWFSKCVPWATGISVTWVFDRNTNGQFPYHMYVMKTSRDWAQSLGSNEPSRRFGPLFYRVGDQTQGLAHTGQYRRTRSWPRLVIFLCALQVCAWHAIQ